MTQENREGKWASPERQEDLKYQERMKEFFSPGSSGGARSNSANSGRMRGPLKDDTAVIDPIEPGRGQDTPPAGYARGSQRGSERGFQGESVQDTGKPDLRRVLLFTLGALAVLAFLIFVAWFLFLRGGGEAGQEQPQKIPTAAPSASEPIETNLTFEAQDGEGDAYAIRMGEYEWEGTKRMNGDVERGGFGGPDRGALHDRRSARRRQRSRPASSAGRSRTRPLVARHLSAHQNRWAAGDHWHLPSHRQKSEVVLEGAYTDRIVEDNPGDEPDVVVREYVEGDP